jgi:hypothetical protein
MVAGMTHRDAIMIVCIPPTHFGRIIPLCADTLSRGLKMCDLGAMGDVIERIEAANLQVWMITDGDEPVATCFTDINEEADGGRFIAVYGLAGRRVWKWARALSDRLAEFAREERCSRVMFAGRPGWTRLLPEFHPVREQHGQLIWERAVGAVG